MMPRAVGVAGTEGAEAKTREGPVSGLGGLAGPGGDAGFVQRVRGAAVCRTEPRWHCLPVARPLPHLLVPYEKCDSNQVGNAGLTE